MDVLVRLLANQGIRVRQQNLLRRIGYNPPLAKARDFSFKPIQFDYTSLNISLSCDSQIKGAHLMTTLRLNYKVNMLISASFK